MAGIYIHIPYCRQACHYCNFHFSVYQGNRSAFVGSLLKEITLQRDFLRPEAHQQPQLILDTLYLGGGTPSLLPAGELQMIFEQLGNYYQLGVNAEVTLEANPDDLTPDKLRSLRQTPVNRLSIGIQSFHEPDLRYMNRVHSKGQALQSLEDALDAGFSNLTVDLIYGTPTLDDKQWEQNILKVISLGIPHVSAYALTVEKKTALEVFIRKGKATPVDEEQTARQFDILLSLMHMHGYQQYEISNFSLPGHYSRHNLSYWTGQHYLGLGPSAHSYKQGQRWWNIANTCAYIDALEKGSIPCETEILTPNQLYDEYLMTSLRTMWGCDLQEITRRWGGQRASLLEAQAEKYISGDLMQKTGRKLVLTNKGKLLADGIASDLFIVE